MVVGGDACDNFDAVGLCSSDNFRYVIGIDGGGLVGRLVDDEVRVVVVADGNGNDLHGAKLRSNTRDERNAMTKTKHGQEGRICQWKSRC